MHRQRWNHLTRRAAAALALASALLAGCSDDSDDGPLAGDTPAADSSTTAVDTTVAETTTTLAPLTVDRLAAALPTAADAPFGWTVAGEPKTTFEPAEGPSHGWCNGPNLDARAQSHGAVAVAWQGFSPGRSQYSGVLLYAFADEDAAAAFFDGEKAVVESCPTYQYDISDIDAHVFTRPRADVTWTSENTMSIGGAGEVDADDAFLVAEHEWKRTHAEGGDYGLESTVLSLRERHGRLVLITSLGGQHNVYGFSNAEPGAQPDPQMLRDAADTFRKVVLERIGEP